MAKLGPSSQSTGTRVAILASLYATVLLCLPFAWKLVSVERQPLDRERLKHWGQRLAKTCPIRLPVHVSLQHARRSEDLAWASAVAGQVEQWLTLASERDAHTERSAHSLANSWCADWHVQWSELAKTDADLNFELERYGLVSQNGSEKASLTDYSSESVSLALSRRVAQDLGLPFKSRLVQAELVQATHIQGGQEAAAQDPTPEPAPAVADAQTTSASPADVQRSNSPKRSLPALALPDDESILRELSIDGSSGLVDSSETAVPLPTRLLLSFHVLNEDLQPDASGNTSTFVVGPLTSGRQINSSSSVRTFASRLQHQLQPLATAIQDVVDIGFETHWGIGAETKGVKWETVEWNADEKYQDFEERTVEEVFEEDVEDDDVDPVETNVSADSNTEAAQNTDEGTKSPATTLARRRSVTRTRTELVSVDKHRSVKKHVYALASDQLEIFVEEGGWGLEDQQQVADQRGRRFPALFPSDKSSLGEGSTRTLHLILYKPSHSHTPLIYVPQDDEEPRQGASLTGQNSEKEQSFYHGKDLGAMKNKIATAVAQESNPVHWGWTVPGWGGVAIYNARDRPSEEMCSLSAGGLALCRLGDADEYEILQLWSQQIHSLLGMNSAVTEVSTEAPNKQRLAHFDLLRRTLLFRTRDALESLMAFQRVVDQLGNLEIGSLVAEQMHAALSSLDHLDSELRSCSGHSSCFFAGEDLDRKGRIFALAAAAASQASAAFHHHRMLGLLYFPAEHTWAVYTPLFGPLAVPLLLATLKEVKRWLQKRRNLRLRDDAKKED